MTLLRFLARPPSRVISRPIFLPRSPVTLIARPLRIPPNRHHVSPCSLRLSSSLPDRARPAAPSFKAEIFPAPTFHRTSTRTFFMRRRRVYQVAFFVLFVGAAVSVMLVDIKRRQWRELNDRRFVRYSVASREQVSPTAFVLTVRPPRDPERPLLDWCSYLFPWVFPKFRTPEAVLDEIWAQGATWSVEIKQPQLQVARDYTPLPPRDVEGKRGGELRFLIRRMDGGEVSNYLSKLKIGQVVELRGPHYGFDARRRLRDKDRVVFLAGGTGIAPALQVAKSVLEGEKREASGPGPKVDILWANRQRADCVGCPHVKDPHGDLSGAKGGPILDQLAEMQRKFPGRVTVRCTVDEEKNSVQMGTLAGLITSAGVRRPSGGGLEGNDCWLHSQDAVAWRPAADSDAEQAKDPEAVDCNCTSGKNLLFVSGPDGFIEHFAGPKRWANGRELQGPVGGILARLRAKYPEAMNDWLVLKL